MMSETAQTIIQKIETSRNQIIRLYHSVPVTEILKPTLPMGWSVKELLAHIAAWEWRCAAVLAEARASNGPLLATPDVHALNREFREERQGWSWEEVEQDFRLAHQTLIQTLKDLPPERLEDKVVLRTIAKDTWEEYERFLPDLQHWHTQITHQPFHKN